MNKEQVLEDIRSLISDIDKCTADLVKAYLEKNDVEVYDKHLRMESIMLRAHQELEFLYDYIQNRD